MGLLKRPVLAGEMDGLKQFFTEDPKAVFKAVPIELVAASNCENSIPVR